MRRGERGSVTLLALAVTPFLFVVLALVADLARVYAVKIAARRALNLALRAAAGQVDPVRLADPVNPAVEIQPGPAAEAFTRVLRQNLRVDEAYRPLPGSVADGPVTVLDFRVVNPGNLPFTYRMGPYAETITRVSATAVIEVPVRLSAFARLAQVPELAPVRVHSTVGPEVLPGD